MFAVPHTSCGSRFEENLAHRLSNTRSLWQRLLSLPRTGAQASRLLSSRARARRFASETLALQSLAVLLLILTSVRAEHLPVKTYTTVDGLLRDSAYCIVQ